MTALVAKAAAADGSALNAEAAFLMGTARGGEALQLPVGRVAADHAADLVLLDLDAISLQPQPTTAKQIVYSMQPEAIRQVIVGGVTVVEEGRLLTVDEREIVARVREVTAGWSVPEPTPALTE